MSLYNFTRWQLAAILDLIEPEIAPFDLPTMKSIPRTKHTVDRMTHCGDNCGHSEFDISRRVHLGPHFEEGEVVGVIDRTIGKSYGGLPYAPHCEYCPISNYSAAICHRMSAALDSTGVG